MNKKEFKKPVIKIVNLEATSILAASGENDSPSTSNSKSLKGLQVDHSYQGAFGN